MFLVLLRATSYLRWGERRGVSLKFAHELETPGMRHGFVFWSFSGVFQPLFQGQMETKHLGGKDFGLSE